MEKLKAYIDKKQQQGISDEQIKESLIAVGWDETTINNILVDDIPKPDEEDAVQVEFAEEGPFKLDGRTKVLFFFSYLSSVFGGVFFLIIIFGSALPDMDWFALAMVGLFVIGIVCYLLASLEYSYRYSLTENGFQKEFGIIAKKYATIPYERIQNIDISQTFVERILGIYNIGIQTAGLASSSGRFGGRAAEGILPGLSQEEANRLRDELLQRARKSSKQGI